MKNKIFLLANHIVGLDVCKFLEDKEEIVGLAIPTKDKQKYTTEIIKASGLSEDYLFEAPQLREKETLDKIRNLNPDYSISCFWGYIMKQEFLDIAQKENINFHPGYLPYNRGMNPNVWPIVEGTPAGVTIHKMDKGIDTGDILARREVPIEPTDTGGSLYDKTLVEIVQVFKENWEGIKDGSIVPISQRGLESTFHYAKDVDELDEIDLDKKYTGRELIDILRSRTYGEKSFAHYYDKGVKIHIGVNLYEDDFFQYLLPSDCFNKKIGELDDDNK